MNRVAFPCLVTLGLLSACGPTVGIPASESSSGSSSAASATATDPDPTLSGAETTTGHDPTTSTAAGSETSQTSQDDNGNTSSPPLFDLGMVPDMPMEPPSRLPEFDCDNAPQMSVSYQLINGPRGYHGLAITPSGLAIGSDGSSLIESTYDGIWGVFIPGIGQGQQMDWLADGDLAHATNDGAITRIRLDGTTEVIQPGVNAYGVVVGPDDQLYVTPNAGNSVLRIDPQTGASEALIPGNGDNFHSVGFSPDGQRLYIGTIGNGTLYYVDLDNDMNPTTGLQVLAGGVGGGWHDAVAVDLCGYIYVPDFFSKNLYRISPGGDVVVFWSPPANAFYAHGLTWGTGEHGWREDALYFPQPYNGNTVGEVVVGVPPRDWPAIPINAPVPL